MTAEPTAIQEEKKSPLFTSGLPELSPFATFHQALAGYDLYWNGPIPEKFQDRVVYPGEKIFKFELWEKVYNKPNDLALIKDLNHPLIEVRMNDNHYTRITFDL